MKNGISPKQKEYFVKTGKNHAFGIDFEIRELMEMEEIVKRFDKVWNEELSKRIEGGEAIESEDVKRRVGEKSRGFVRTASLHKEFRFSGALWIAQVTDDSNDQLWIVPKSEYDTRSIVATFKTQEQRDDFAALAQRHGIAEQDYARRILTAHLSVYRED